MIPIRSGRRGLIVLGLVAGSVLLRAGRDEPQRRQPLTIRGHEQALHVYGSDRGDPVIVSSGDGGWVHLAPQVAAFLASHGCYVVGFDVKVYLSSFTSPHATLRQTDTPADYRALVDVARQPTGRRPILIGVSEGAGLSVLAATDPETKASIAGVIGLGLPDLTELGWRWKDSLIYLTHRVPDEPTFSAAAIVARVAPLPLAAIHSTHDEFVPLADAERVMAAAGAPKRLWIVNVAHHRFSGNVAEFERQLLEALTWVRQHAA